MKIRAMVIWIRASAAVPVVDVHDVHQVHWSLFIFCASSGLLPTALASNASAPLNVLDGCEGCVFPAIRERITEFALSGGAYVLISIYAEIA